MQSILHKNLKCGLKTNFFYFWIYLYSRKDCDAVYRQKSCNPIYCVMYVCFCYVFIYFLQGLPGVGGPVSPVSWGYHNWDLITELFTAGLSASDWLSLPCGGGEDQSLGSADHNKLPGCHRCHTILVMEMTAEISPSVLLTTLHNKARQKKPITINSRNLFDW